jgi:hypothetical protein
LATTDSRRLHVFFSSGPSRYAVEAVSVLEVARPGSDDELTQRHLGLRDLSVLLGGEAEVRPGAALILDTSPTLAVRVREVEGVFDVSNDPELALSNRLISLVAPAVSRGLLHEGRLVFELDVSSSTRGLPRQTKRPELITLAPSTPCLVFASGHELLGVPLPRVLQVTTIGPTFNHAPGSGAFRGVLAHGQQLCPVYSVSDAPALEAFIVLLELGGEILGLTAHRAEGVKAPSALAEVRVLDLERMFS